ncbi:hypothetical protein KIK84_10530 [Curvibacter sp. CHRR-16]|uniref:hypothetical protein n=1 Tax=Curvibacter sp. CHRR-16 TaxID=2835872 RepID=UPI001BD956A6|nr:hypothetical protein [Curvibacter sp. CHRR-16]MBT0570765.1 hypothetical protein [Curvibacter sp. CHRR-16]
MQRCLRCFVLYLALYLAHGALLLCGAIWPLSLHAQPVDDAVWQPSPESLPQWQSALDARKNRLFDHGVVRTRQTSIDVAGFALDAIALRYDPSTIDDALRALVSLQDANPSSPTYGNMHWYAGDTKLVDRNGIEFVVRKLVLIPLLYANHLSPEQRTALERIGRLAKEGITRHQVPISYTNIYLMKTWNLIAMGDALHDASLATQGHNMLRDWLAYTAQSGINEYLSPTYYEVDLDNLALIANVASNEATRAAARSGLNFLWHDIALHWFTPGARLGGVHSRDYDRLFNTGALNRKMAQTSWLPTTLPLTGASIPLGGPYEHYAWTTPPQSARQWLERPFPRFIVQRWGPAPEQRLAHYMGRNVGVSSADAIYRSGHDNAPLVINMGSGAQVPIINYFMDGRRDYYGVNKTLEAGSGHMKALHLKPFATSVQNDAQVLFMASIQNDVTQNAALESVITLPADAQYWINDKPVELYTTRSAWQYDVAPNGSSTRIAVQQDSAGRTHVQLTDEDAALGVGIARTLPAVPGSNYRIRTQLQGGDIYLYLNFYDAAQRLIGTEHNLRVRGGDTAAVERSLSYVAPAGAATVKAWIYSTSSNRTQVRIDDLRLERVDGVQAELLAGFDFSVHQAQAVELPLGQTLLLRREDVAVALRPVWTQGVDGQPVAWTLFNDGLAYNAVRLTATHASGPQAGRGTAVVWAYAQEGIQTDADFAAFVQRVLRLESSVVQQGNQVDARVSGLTGEMRLVADVVRGQRLLHQGQRPIPENAVYWIDDRDWIADLF